MIGHLTRFLLMNLLRVLALCLGVAALSFSAEPSPVPMTKMRTVDAAVAIDRQERAKRMVPCGTSLARQLDRLAHQRLVGALHGRDSDSSSKISHPPPGPGPTRSEIGEE